MSNTTLGIDVGKFELAIALRKDGKFTDKLVENNSKGFQKILKFLEKMHRKQKFIWRQRGVTTKK